VWYDLVAHERVSMSVWFDAVCYVIWSERGSTCSQNWFPLDLRISHTFSCMTRSQRVRAVSVRETECFCGDVRVELMYV
jgi:hypothetical protein